MDLYDGGEEYDYYDDGEDYGYVDEGPEDESDLPPQRFNVPQHIATTTAADRDEFREATTLSMEGALTQQAAVVEEVAQLTFLSGAASALLLNEFLWSKDVAVERYFEDQNKVLQQMGLSLLAAQTEATLCIPPAGTTAMCGVCGSDYEAVEVAFLSTCRHTFCKECWRDQIRVHVGDHLLRTRCLADGCQELVSLAVMTKLFSEQEADAVVLKDVRRHFLSRYVETCPSLYWCPNPRGCSGIVHVAVPPLEGQGVRCDVCYAAFCLRCAEDPHRPARCSNVRDWRAFCQREGANTAYILISTKKCPKCSIPIQKNGGCNHMACKCGFDFCWVCGGDWKTHQGDFYSCRNAATVSELNNANPELQRSKNFLYHYERYTLHLDSGVRDAKLLDRYTNGDPLLKAALPEANTLPGGNEVTGNDLDLLTKVKKVLLRARHTMAYAYVQMYYMKDSSPELLLVAHRAGKLEEATENLSRAVKDVLTCIMTDIGSMRDLLAIVEQWEKVVSEA